jgi:hypothetical protein
LKFQCFEIWATITNLNNTGRVLCEKRSQISKMQTFQTLHRTFVAVKNGKKLKQRNRIEIFRKSLNVWSGLFKKYSDVNFHYNIGLARRVFSSFLIFRFEKFVLKRVFCHFFTIQKARTQVRKIGQKLQTITERLLKLRAIKSIAFLLQNLKDERNKILKMREKFSTAEDFRLLKTSFETLKYVRILKGVGRIVTEYFDQVTKEKYLKKMVCVFAFRLFLKNDVQNIQRILNNFSKRRALLKWSGVVEKIRLALTELEKIEDERRQAEREAKRKMKEKYVAYLFLNFGKLYPMARY